MAVKYPKNAVIKKLGKSLYVTLNDDGIICHRHGNDIVGVKYPENTVTKMLGKSQYVTPNNGGIISTPGAR